VTSGVQGLKLDDKPILRKLLLEGNFFIASALSNSLTKLVLRYANINKGKLKSLRLRDHSPITYSGNPPVVNKLAGECALILSSIIHLGKSGLCKNAITEDDLDRLSTTLRLIIDQWPDATEVFLNECRASLELMLVAKGDVDRHEEHKKKKPKIVQVQLQHYLSSP